MPAIELSAKGQRNRERGKGSDIEEEEMAQVGQWAFVGLWASGIKEKLNGVIWASV